jgi:anthranilate phosphoribosyltransferase
MHHYPVQPQYQLSGVFEVHVARIYRSILSSERKGFSVVHSLDGYDEVSLTSAFKHLKRNEETLVFPKELGLDQISEIELSGGRTISDAEKIVRDILTGDGTEAQNRVVLANAALGMQCMEAQTFESAYERAERSLQDGSAAESMATAIKLS